MEHRPNPDEGGFPIPLWLVVVIVLGAVGVVGTLLVRAQLRAQREVAAACYGTFRVPVTAYPVNPNATTPAGWSLDDPKRELVPDQVDRAIANVQGCLATLRVLNPEELARANCGGTRLTKPEIRRCTVIKAAPDWRVSPCSGEQVFPCSAGNQPCLDKGESVDAGCPCSCREAIQDDRVIVVTPNLRLLPSALVRAATGCDNPWAVPDLAVCAAPALSAPP